MQLIFTDKETGKSYTHMIFADGDALYDNSEERYLWSHRGLG